MPIDNIAQEIKQLRFLEQFDQQATKVAVWYTRSLRREEGMVRLKARGIKVTEEQMLQISDIYSAVWQLDVMRPERSTCFLCRRELPDEIEEYCECFREARVDVYYNLLTVKGLKSLAESYPDTWRNKAMYTMQCEDCGIHVMHTARVVEKYVRGKPPHYRYKIPTRCSPCHYVKMKGRPSTRPSKPPKEPSLEQAKNKIVGATQAVAKT